jgi:deoxyadenosine/deoxycytidine kinase
MKKYIAVAGNIGVGKSTLVRLLCERLGWQPFFEPVAQNPYLEDFYRDMNTWGFHSQVFFLAHRLHIHRQILLFPGSVIQDRSVYEDAEIFAVNLFQQGCLSQRDFDTYCALYHSLVEFLPSPDLVIYLRASTRTLQARINQRARQYERVIDPDYLESLNQLYEQWISGFSLCPVLAVPSDDLDYVSDPRALDLVTRKVEQKLSGKEEVVFSQDELPPVR